MASSTKIIETIRARKRNKLLVARTKRVRLTANKKAANTPEALRRFVAGASKVPLAKTAAERTAAAGGITAGTKETSKK